MDTPPAPSLPPTPVSAPAFVPGTATPAAASLPPTPVAAPALSPELQAVLDAEHLRLLQIGYYILGAMTILRIVWLAFIAVMFGFIGTMSTLATQRAFQGSANGPPPQFFFVFFACFFAVMIFLSLAFVCLEFYAAHCLKTRRNILVIQIVAAFYCISIPWGTAVGVCTFMVLGRPSVRALFR